jgi:predicted GTPase
MLFLYREQLPRLDLVLWLIKADDRAAVDEHFYRQVIGEATGIRCCLLSVRQIKSEPTSRAINYPQRNKTSAAKSACCMSCSSR